MLGPNTETKKTMVERWLLNLGVAVSGGFNGNWCKGWNNKSCNQTLSTE